MARGWCGALVLLAVAAQSAAAAPGVTPSVVGLAGADGWYTSSVTLRWTVGTDGLVNTTGCEAATLLTADTPGVTKRCQATYASGVTMTGEALIKIDRTPPVAVHAVPSRPANANGWFAQPVSLAWTGTDATSGIASCSTVGYAGPDVTGVALTGTCRDAAGNVSAPAPFSLNYDATAPVVTGAAAARPPDRRGWYLRPVSMAFQGQDSGSGIDSCDVVGFAGPDGERAVAGGACRDRAGNSTTGSMRLRYDGTPPALAHVRATPGRHVIRLRWNVSRDAVRVVVMRSPGLHGLRSTIVYRGTRRAFTDRHVAHDVRYRYAVTAVDAHAKTATSRVATTFSLLLAPRRGASLTAPPVLRWRAVAGAGYYNVQLFRGQRLVATAWPSRPRLVLPHLPPGHYRWFVWPGYGSRAQRPYGQLVGHSSFTLG